eukprot:10425815-Alexandrium_andersonii.AAC.1
MSAPDSSGLGGAPPSPEYLSKRTPTSSPTSVVVDGLNTPTDAVSSAGSDDAATVAAATPWADASPPPGPPPRSRPRLALPSTA